MKTTVDLPDELVRRVKLLAVLEDRKLKDVIAELLERGLRQPDEADRPTHRVAVPLVRGARLADPGQEMTPDRVAEVLLAEDAHGAAG